MLKYWDCLRACLQDKTLESCLCISMRITLAAFQKKIKDNVIIQIILRLWWCIYSADKGMIRWANMHSQLYPSQFSSRISLPSPQQKTHQTLQQQSIPSPNYLVCVSSRCFFWVTLQLNQRQLCAKWNTFGVLVQVQVPA